MVPAECAGNVQELCAVKYETTTTWWDFVLCQNSYGRYKVGEPEVTLQCAEKAGIDWLNGSAGRCAGTSRSEWAKGDEGIELLKESVVQTQGLGIVNSCTVVIAGKKVCVRDETWKDCEGGHTSDDFVRQIEKEFARRNNVEVEVSEDDWVLV
ncbi:hypothetical protein QCA50_000627 [Cerrena zonata]|uniref:Uncharacterized protein n=1 Tax=Cerrena zonata TaxID=2478898 RepID=A0AAW0GV47_9APHY